MAAVPKMTHLAFCVVAALTVAGCDTAPERSDEATALQSALRTVAGVTSASTSYEHGGSRGSSMSVDVSMPDASDEQVVAMVRRMNTSMGTDFDQYYVPVTVSLGSGIRLTSIGKMQPDSTARDVSIARRLQKHVTAQSVTVAQTPTGPHISIDAAADSASAVMSTAEAAGQTTADIEVYPAASDGQLIWEVTTPVPQERLRTIAAELTRLPAQAFLVAVRGGLVTRLSVTLTVTGSRARDALRSIIDRLGAGPARPVALNWNLGTPTSGADRQATGSVTVGECAYPKSAGEADPEKYLTADALSLQQQMRSDYDTCPK